MQSIGIIKTVLMRETGILAKNKSVDVRESVPLNYFILFLQI